MNVKNFQYFKLMDLFIQRAYDLTDCLMAQTSINHVNIRRILDNFNQIYRIILHLLIFWNRMLEHILNLSVKISLSNLNMSELDRWLYLFLRLKRKNRFHCLFYLCINEHFQSLIFVTFGVQPNVKVLFYFFYHLRFQNVQ